jgi:hypothetical protein
MKRVLDMYLRGELTNSEVEEWADAIESRDDIGYGSPTDHRLKQLVFKLANPLLTEKITPATATAWRAALGDSSTAG